MSASLPQEPRRQWASLSLPPLVWAAQELTSTYVAFAMCRRADPGGARTVLLAVTAVALPIATVAATASYWQWRALVGTRRLWDAEGRSRAEMLSLAGIFLGVIFSIAITWTALPLLLLRDLCEARQ